MSASPATPFDDGELYDALLGNIDYGLEFYRQLAQAATGPVLDIACGTGRVLLPCLQAGVDIEGLDLFTGMLDTLRNKALSLVLQPTLHHSDMRQFQLQRRYALIMIPFNAFVHNLSTDDQIRCLTCCREHLLPRGQLVFDTFFPGAALITAPDFDRVLELETRHPVTGRTLRLYDIRSFDRVAQRQHSSMEIEELDDEGHILHTHRSETTIRWIYAGEMELLLRVAGFDRWQITGDFAGRPLEQETDAMIVAAWNGSN